MFSTRRDKLGLIRQLLDAAEPGVQHAPDTPPDEPAAVAPATTPATTPPCPCCGGPMRVIEILIDPRRCTSRFDTS